MGEGARGRAALPAPVSPARPSGKCEMRARDGKLLLGSGGPHGEDLQARCWGKRETVPGRGSGGQRRSLSSAGLCSLLGWGARPAVMVWPPGFRGVTAVFCPLSPRPLRSWLWPGGRKGPGAAPQVTGVPFGC